MRYRITMNGAEVERIEEAGKDAGTMVFEVDSPTPVTEDNVLGAVVRGMGLSAEMAEVAASLSTLAK